MKFEREFSDQEIKERITKLKLVLFENGSGEIWACGGKYYTKGKINGLINPCNPFGQAKIQKLCRVLDFLQCELVKR